MDDCSGEPLLSAAVLIPIIQEDGELSVLLTLRTDTVETHKGQIAFPGGMVDRTDRDRVHTAVREAEEELGIPPASVEVLGMLDDLTTPTGFCITPVVGLLAHLPALRLSPGEVAEAFTVPLAFFADPAHATMEIRTVRGAPREIWTYQYGTYVIWGATGTIMHRFMAILGAP